MFLPVSAIEYVMLEPTAQALVVATPPVGSQQALRTRWGKRVVAVMSDAVDTRDVVRDLLANPLIRVVVLDGEIRNRQQWDAFWFGGSDFRHWKIDNEHIMLVRQYVDLFDDDFAIKGPMQPFWPSRVRYLE